MIFNFFLYTTWYSRKRLLEDIKAYGDRQKRLDKFTGKPFLSPQLKLVRPLCLWTWSWCCWCLSLFSLRVRTKCKYLNESLSRDYDKTYQIPISSVLSLKKIPESLSRDYDKKIFFIDFIFFFTTIGPPHHLVVPRVLRVREVVPHHPYKRWGVWISGGFLAVWTE